MSLSEEMTNIIYMSIGKEKRVGISWIDSEIATVKILELINKRIDEMIGVDNQTINMKNGSMEGKIAAHASKNTLILVKEMLK